MYVNLCELVDYTCDTCSCYFCIMFCVDLFQTRPHGGIFFTKYNESNDSVELSYTIIENELTLYELYGLPGNNSFSSMTDMEIQRRLLVIFCFVHYNCLYWINQTSIVYCLFIMIYMYMCILHLDHVRCSNTCTCTWASSVLFCCLLLLHCS